MPIQESPPVGGLSFLNLGENVREGYRSEDGGSVTFLSPNKKVTKEAAPFGNPRRALMRCGAT